MAAAIRLSQQHSCSLDHLVGAREQARWDFKTECLGGSKINDELEFRGLLDGDRRSALVVFLEFNPYRQTA
jgi:hypothetical protein